MVRVTDDLEIADTELVFSTSRSSGPGGQNVNKVNTRVTLLFDLEGSAALSVEQRALLRQKLPGRISKDGVLRVVSQRHRTQLANRDAAVRRFADLVREALTEAPERVPIPLPARAKARRLEAKRQRGRLKRERTVGVDFED
jgi:ribosome-associated protein